MAGKGRGNGRGKGKEKEKGKGKNRSEDSVMTSLSQTMLLPPRFKNVRPSNSANRFKQIGPFIFWNLSQALLSPPHYETSMYGAANAYLYGIFPLEKYFLIKPQGMIRPIVDEEDDSDEDAQDEEEVYRTLDTSMGSYLGGHQARGQGQREVGKDFVDFVAVKVAVVDVETKLHIPLVLIELKKTFVRSDDLTAQGQMLRYMEHMALQPTCPKDLVGYLLQSRKAMRFHLDWNEDGTADVIRGPMFDVLTSDTMTPELLEIAHKNWDFVDSVPDVQ